MDESDNDRALRWSLQALTTKYIAERRFGDAQVTFERLMEDFSSSQRTLREYAYFLATYTDQYLRLAEIAAEARRVGCDCEKELNALVALVEAAQAAGNDRATSVRKLVQAQSAGLSMSQTTAQLSLGGSGRLLLDKLVPDTISIQEIESQGSVLIRLFDPAAEDGLKFALELGADTNAIDPSVGVSPLMLAVYLHNAGMAEQFMQYGGDPLKETEEGVSAMKLAQESDNQEILALLSSGRA